MCTFERRGETITRPEFVGDEGEIESILSEHYSSADARAYATGSWLDYGESTAGWAFYARLEPARKLERDLDIDDEFDTDAPFVSWDDLVDWEPGAGTAIDDAPRTTKSEARAKATSRQGVEPIVHARAASSETWSTAAPIRWSVVGAHGMVGVSTDDVRGAYFTTVWTSDADRTRATPRKTISGAHGTGVHSVDEASVELIDRGVLWRVDRTRDVPAEQVGAAPQPFGITSVRKGEDLYAAVSDGVIRIDRDGKRTQLLKHDFVPPMHGGPETSCSLFALPDAIAYLRTRRRIGTELQLVRPSDGSVEMLLSTVERFSVAARGDALFVLTDDDRELRVFRDRKSTRTALDGWGSFFSQPEGLYLRIRGPHSTVYALDAEHPRPIGDASLVPEAFGWVSIFGDRVFGYPRSASAPLTAYALVT